MRAIRLLPGRMAMLRYGAGEPFSLPEAGAGFFSLIRTDRELSIVMEESRAPRKAPRRSAGWRLFEVEGPFALGVVGVLAPILARLAEAGVSVFALATYDTDYFLVSGRQLARAMKAMRAAGHDVSEAG